MRSIRGVRAWPHLVALVLMASGGPVVAAATPTTEDVPAEVVLDVTGSIMVTYSDLEDDALREVFLVVDDAMVPIAADSAAIANPRDEFEGSLIVPDTVLVAAEPEVLQALDDAGAAPLDAESNLGGEILELAAGSDSPLELVDAEFVTAAGSNVVPPTDHALRVAVVRPAGTTQPFTTSKAAEIADFAEQYWYSQSHGIVRTLRGPEIAYSSALDCTASPAEFWVEALAAFGISQTLGQFVSGSSGSHVVVLLPAACASMQPLGIANVGDSANDNGVALEVVGQSVDRSVLVHELGHNLGLGHADVAACDDDAISGCDTFEYADVYDPMGASLVAQGDVPPSLSIAAGYRLGFLSDAQVPLVEMSASVGEETVLLDLERLDTPPEVYTTGYRLRDPVSGEVWFVEYRAASFGGGGSPFWMNPYGAIELDDSRVLVMGGGIRLVGPAAEGHTRALAFEDAPGEWTAAYDVGEDVSSPTGGLRVEFVSGGPGSGADVRVTFRVDQNAAAASPVYRFWSPSKRTHFFTISATERDFVIANYDDTEWLYEGIAYTAFTTPTAGAIPLYRFWSTRYQGHFYTADQQERDAVIANYPDDEWLYEDVAFYVYPANATIPGAVPVGRFWSDESRHHFYTADPAERRFVIDNYPDGVWRYEDIAFRVPAP